jgi:ABC-type dipeptide/oligopeptide/nickel transport system ATPase component
VSEPVLSIRDLVVDFRSDAGVVRAVDGVSLDVHAGEVVAVVGESGSGKSTLALCALAMLGRGDGATVSGSVAWRGVDLLAAPAPVLRRVRGAEIGYVGQDPTGTFSPVHRVGRQIADVLALHRGARPGEAAREAVELLRSVGIADAARRARSYPHELSGGMCQRAAIAMAIACEPALLVADEPTTALDVTVQADVLELLAEMRARFGAAMLLVTHDLAIVEGVADRVAVMRAGRVVEQGRVGDVLGAPADPYTRSLLAAAAQVSP